MNVGYKHWSNDSNSNMQPITIKLAVRVGLYLYISLSASCTVDKTVTHLDETSHIPKFEEDGNQRDDEEALRGRERWIRGSVGQLCGDGRIVREGRSAP